MQRRFWHTGIPLMWHKADIPMPDKQCVFISHGGGPLPLLGDPDHQQLVQQLTRLATQLTKPRAILIISAHWEAAVATVSSSLAPELLYDYYGFPEESYQITYPAAGEPTLAAAVLGVLQQAGFATCSDLQRGFDHGVFVPLKIIYPAADIPCVQLSLLQSLDAATHYRLGQALRQLDYPGLLVMGSGFSFHNMREFFMPATPEKTALVVDFHQWLTDTLCNPAYNEAKRQQALQQWQQAPGARFCHPREEHLLPLLVCAGYAAAPCPETMQCQVFGKESALFYWPDISD